MGVCSADEVGLGEETVERPMITDDESITHEAAWQAGESVAGMASIDGDH